MATWAQRLEENAPGEFFVDDSCIDCDICRHVAPATFARSDRELSFVHTQPDTGHEEQRALMALVACPTSSIGTRSKRNTTAGVAAFPEPIDLDGGGSDLPQGDAEVLFCGFASERSFGASSYLIRRPDGNVLVDSPRAARPLLRRLEALGGVRWMFLTHRDDVADHQRFRDHFGCERVLHQADLGGSIPEVERTISGSEPVVLARDLVVIPVPGHTRGSATLLYRDTCLFTGDHLWWSAPRGRLYASPNVCWYSWSEQRSSMKRLLAHAFTWILPGHGRRFHTRTVTEMHAEVQGVYERMGERAG